MPSPFFISAIVTKDVTTKTIATLPRGTSIEDVTIYVKTAFNGGATIKVGYAGDDEAYSEPVDVTTLGRKKPTLGGGIGLDYSARLAQAYVTGSPTVGEAIVVLDGKNLPIL